MIKRLLVVLLGCAMIFVAGYLHGRTVCKNALEAEIHAAFVEGQRDITSYVESCTLANAHARLCSIPCGSPTDCVQKNGTKEAY